MEFSDILYILISLLFSSVVGFISADELIKDNVRKDFSIVLGCVLFIATLTAMMKGIYW